MHKLLAVIITLWMSNAWAEVPKEIAAANNLKHYSRASLNWLMFKAYDADLWVAGERWSYEAPFALTLTYDMAFSTEELVSKTLEEMADIYGKSIFDDAGLKASLEKSFPAVKKSDRITAFFDPKNGAEFYYNGSFTNAIKDVSVAKQFFQIWLSNKTSQPQLRKSLLKL